jgi:hypothetical protein
MPTVCLMLLLPDELLTKIIIHPIKDEPVFHFLNLRNKICATFRRICNSNEVLLHVSLCDLPEVYKNRYIGSCFERCFREANHPEALCFEGMERLMRRRNPDKGLRLVCMKFKEVWYLDSAKQHPLLKFPDLQPVLNWSVSYRFCSQKFNFLVFLIGIADYARPLLQYL